MTRLSIEAVLKENGTQDPSQIRSLVLTHKALTDVSCLSELVNLERLDLGFNMLTSLEGLKGCANLKWLSLIQNKLQSLKGIEGLTKLTVLNVGKNKLRSMDEVQSVVSLRALILNDNEITSICPLDQLKELNTLVLSKNPVRDIKKSLEKLKSLTKLSLSHCQLQRIGSSLKSCTELKELRLAQNELTALPLELVNNVKIHTLDLGNNSIINWSDLKVLSSLPNLKNLNLHGNPIADKDKFANKVKRLIPNLQILNSKPIEKFMNEKQGQGDGESVASKVETFEKEGHAKESKKKGTREDSGNEDVTEKPKKKKTKRNSKQYENTLANKASETTSKDSRMGEDDDMIDDTGTPFSERLMHDLNYQTATNIKLNSIHNNADQAIVKVTSKKKKARSLASGSKALEQLATSVDVGSGGLSTWE